MAKTQNQNQKPDHASNLQKIQHKDTMIEKFYNTNKLVFFFLLWEKERWERTYRSKKNIKRNFYKLQDVDFIWILIQTDFKNKKKIYNIFILLEIIPEIWY